MGCQWRHEKRNYLLWDTATPWARFGGPLFFSHYSFMGINPHDLTDTYANYFTQNTNQSLDQF